MRHAARVDANQPAIVRDLRRLGFRVDLTHRLGKGFPDLIVTGYSMTLDAVAALLVEVKDGREGLTDDEKVFHAAYPEGGPLIVARAADDVLRWFGRL